MSKKTDLDTLDALQKMRDRFKAAEEAETLNRISAEDALSFYWGKQWAADIEASRKADSKPCFTLNKLPAILKQVINEGRANPPTIEISPVSDGANEDTAEALQGLTRHVEAMGEGSEVAYETAFLYMVIGGFGSWRVLHDYLPKSFDQDLFLERIKNPFSVYWDPGSSKLDKSDAKFCFITKDFDCDGYKAEFPDSELAGLNDFSGVGDQASGWASKNSCRVVEYFYVESEDVELLQLEDGSTCYEDELPKGARIATGEDGAPISRRDKRKTAWVAKSNGVEWLEKPEKLPTDDIPVVSVFGDALVIDGEDLLKGAVTDLMEPARLFNYNSSAIAETMALGSKAQWVATVEQIEPFKAIWQQSNSRNIAVLPYKNVAGVNPPQKISTEPPIQAMSAARLQSADDLRSISGVYDATQAPNGGEESGKAILARRHQSSTGNANYNSNMARGVKRTAQILLKYFRVIYDVPRVMRITGLDEQPKQIMIHAGQPESVPQQLPEGVKDVFDLNVGVYDVKVSVGKSDESKRQESLEMLLTLCQANPAIVPIISDLVVQEMDFSGKKAVVARLQKALPPNLQDNADNPTDPQQLQNHNSMLMQQNSQLMKQVQQLAQAQQMKQVESASRERVEATKLQAAEVTAQSRVEQANIAAQVSILKEAASKSFDAVHSHAMADKAQVHKMMSANHAAALAPPPAAPVEHGA